MPGRGGAERGAGAWPGALPRRALAVYAALGAAAVYVLVRDLGGGTDFDAFLPFGIAGLGGLNPYSKGMMAVFADGPLWSTWPPAFAPVAALLARLEAAAGLPAAMVLWQAAGLLAVAGVLRVWTGWLYGRSLSLRPRAGGLPLYSLPALAGLLVPARLVLSNFEHAQANLQVLGLAVAGLWLLRAGRRWSGGLAVGLSTAFKATPLLLLPYLAWRGRWRDLAGSLGGVLVAWVVLPVLLLGGARTADWYRSWGSFVETLPIPVIHTNQSLPAAVSRLLAPPGTAAPFVEGAGPLGAYGAPVLVAGLAALVAVAAAAAFGRPGRRVPARREALETGVVFALMALFSPVAWKHHFALLLPVSAALWAWTPGAPRPRATAAATGADGTLYLGLGAVAVAVNGTATGLVGGTLADRFEQMSVVTVSALALVLMALWVLYRDRRRRAAGAAAR